LHFFFLNRACTASTLLPENITEYRINFKGHIYLQSPIIFEVFSLLVIKDHPPFMVGAQR